MTTQQNCTFYHNNMGKKPFYHTQKQLTSEITSFSNHLTIRWNSGPCRPSRTNMFLIIFPNLIKPKNYKHKSTKHCNPLNRTQKTKRFFYNFIWRRYHAVVSSLLSIIWIIPMTFQSMFFSQKNTSGWSNRCFFPLQKLHLPPQMIEKQGKQLLPQLPLPLETRLGEIFQPQTNATANNPRIFLFEPKLHAHDIPNIFEVLHRLRCEFWQQHTTNLYVDKNLEGLVDICYSIANVHIQTIKKTPRNDTFPLISHWCGRVKSTFCPFWSPEASEEFCLWK